MFIIYIESEKIKECVWFVCCAGEKINNNNKNYNFLFTIHDIGNEHVYTYYNNKTYIYFVCFITNSCMCARIQRGKK